MDSDSPRKAERDVNPQLIKRLVLGFSTAVVLWVFFFVAWSSFPLIRPGNNQIYSEKISMVAEEPLFRNDAEVKLVISGNSRILSGFKPDVFASRSRGRVSAFNLGLPAADHFIEELETMVGRGQIPTHVFLTVPWATEAASSGLERFWDDNRLMDAIFPFRRFIRDLTLFSIRSRSRGGLAAYYRKGQEYQDQMRAARGYFFIEGQSHHAGHRLPDDFTLDSDHPTSPEPRPIRLEGPVFDRLIALRERAGFRVSFVPYYVRSTAAASAASNAATAEALEGVAIDMIGPNYWSYPNRLFSDPMHLNPDGADCYSAQLWELTRSVLVGSDSSGFESLSTPDGDACRTEELL